MKNNWKGLLCGVLAAVMVTTCPVTADLFTQEVYADEVQGEGDDVVISAKDKPYLALGNDLKDSERATVLQLMGISEDKLADYDVVYVTNKEEHEYLDEYISSSKIGTRALSSVVITQGKKGDGLNITTYNIGYCTVGMYKNALTTAGITDANIIVAGPFELSGTCALVGIMKAYENMTDTTIDKDLVDGALDEIVTTGELEETLTDEQSAQLEALIAEIKEKIASGELESKDDILKEIKELMDKYDLQLTDEQIDKLIALLDKLKDLDLDWEKLADQAANLANKAGEILKKAGKFANSEEGKNIFAKIIDFLKSLLEKLKG